MRQLLLCLLAVSGLRADSLAELRATLQKLQGREPVRMRADISSTRVNGEGKKQKTKQSHGTVLIEEGPGGLRLGWSSEQMEAARAETRRKKADPEAQTPNLDSLRALNAEDASEMLGAAPSLLLKLSQAKILEEKSEAFGGKPARMLHLQMEPAMSTEEKDVMKKFEQRLKVWIDADGAPLGSEESVEFKGSKFLISFGGTQKESATFRKVGGRLIAERTIKENTGSGMGMTQSGKTVVALTAM